MAHEKRVPNGTSQNMCARRKRVGQPHRQHRGQFQDGTRVIIANADPLTGWVWGIVVRACARQREWKTPTKYRVRIDGPGPTEERIVRRSLLSPRVLEE